MTDFSDLLTATKAAADPSTSAADLAQIAQAQPRLWPDIAAHPNAYPDLLAWLDANGDEATKTAVADPVPAVAQPGTGTVATNLPQGQPESQAPVSVGEPVARTSAASSSVPAVAPPTAAFRAPKTTSTPWPKGRRILFGSLGGVVAVAVVTILVVTLVILPNHRAAQAAAAAASASAAAQAQAEQEHQDAVTAFNSASSACTSANTSLSSAITSAQQTAKTDPGTMQDPTLIDKLNQAITTAQTVKHCTAPTMADDTATIQQQTTQLGTETKTVTSATSTLSTVAQAVPASVKAKSDAAAQAAAQAATEAQKGSFTWTDSQGYVYDISWQGVRLTTTIDPTQGAPGQLELQLSFAGTVTVVNKTPGKQAPAIDLFIAPLYAESMSSGDLCNADAKCVTGVVNQQHVVYANLMSSHFGTLGGGIRAVGVSLPPMGVGASVTYQVAQFDNESSDGPGATMVTNTDPAQVEAEVGDVAGWGFSVGYYPPHCITQQVIGFSLGINTDCFAGVSDSLAG